jgi:hypothetical protein
VFVNTGEPIEQEGLMEFRLLYEGELQSSGNKSSPAKKHAIRRKFHLQLRRLWEVHGPLRDQARWLGIQDLKVRGISHDDPAWPEQKQIQTGIESIGREWSRVGYNFIPLVTPKEVVRCSLEILLLRPEETKYVFEQGDIDGQIKTVFDALRIPDSLSETGNAIPQADEIPFYCLLSDDKLISEIRVTADQLLMLPDQITVRANDAFALIHVRINAKYHMTLGPF